MANLEGCSWSFSGVAGIIAWICPTDSHSNWWGACAVDAYVYSVRAISVGHSKLSGLVDTAKQWRRANR